MVKGWAAPYPRVSKAVFAPFATDLEDDEREDAKKEKSER
jgi:hypothetical protein